MCSNRYHDEDKEEENEEGCPVCRDCSSWNRCATCYRDICDECIEEEKCKICQKTFCTECEKDGFFHTCKENVPPIMAALSLQKELDTEEDEMNMALLLSESQAEYVEKLDIEQATIQENYEQQTMPVSKPDPVVEDVVASFRKRSELGIKKYGHTLARKDLSTLQWIQHTQEEAMDTVLYLERLKQEFQCNEKG